MDLKNSIKFSLVPSSPKTLVSELLQLPEFLDWNSHPILETIDEKWLYNNIIDYMLKHRHFFHMKIDFSLVFRNATYFWYQRVYEPVALLLEKYHKKIKNPFSDVFVSIVRDQYSLQIKLKRFVSYKEALFRIFQKETKNKWKIFFIEVYIYIMNSFPSIVYLSEEINNDL